MSAAVKRELKHYLASVDGLGWTPGAPASDTNDTEAED